MVYQRKKIPVNCKHCGEEFLTPKLGKKTAKFCSRKCVSDSQKTGLYYNCESCGEEVYRTQGTLKDRIFCSKECSDKGKVGVNVDNKDFEFIVKACKFCEEDFKVMPCHNHRKYCSHECYSRDAERKEDLICDICGEEFKRVKSKIRSKHGENFCSIKCANKYQLISEYNRGENHPNFLGGALKYYGENWKIQRRKARERDNYKCQDCGMEEKNLDRELDVHHLTPFRTFDNYIDANKLSNLICLCQDCHRFRHSNEGGLPVHTYKDKVVKNIKVTS